MRLKLTKLDSANFVCFICEMTVEKVLRVLSVTTALLLAVSGVLESFMNIYQENLNKEV